MGRKIKGNWDMKSGSSREKLTRWRIWRLYRQMVRLMEQVGDRCLGHFFPGAPSFLPCSGPAGDVGCGECVCHWGVRARWPGRRGAGLRSCQALRRWSRMAVGISGSLCGAAGTEGVFCCREEIWGTGHKDLT